MPWGKFHIETLVPEGSEWLNYGILLVSNGILWADNLHFTIRDPAKCGMTTSPKNCPGIGVYLKT